MQGDDHKISCGSGSCDEGKELRCRNCTHSGIFGLDTALNKAKGGTRCPQRVANQASALPPGILRLWRLFAIGPSRTGIFRRSRSTYIPIFTISRNAGSANSITDKRDWRTSGIPFRREWLLISRSVTGLRSGLTGARSTVDQSPSFAVASRYAVRITLAIPTTALSSPL